MSTSPPLTSISPTSSAGALKRRLISNLAGSWGAMALRLPVAFILTPFLISRLGDERFGAFGVLLALAAYLNLGGGPLDSSIGREYAHAGEDRERRRRVFTNAITLSALVALVTGVAGYLLAAPLVDLLRIPSHIRGDAIFCYGCLVGTVLIAHLAGPFLGLLASRNRYDLLDLVQALGQVAYALLAFLVLGGRAPSLSLLGAAYFVSQLAATLVLIGAALPALRGAWPTGGRFAKPERDEFRTLLGFSGQLLVINICLLLTFQTDNLVISRMIGVAAVAHYTVASNLITRFRQLTYGLSRTFMPATADPDASPARRRELHFRGTRYCTLLVWAVGGVAAALAGPFFVLWLGEAYRSSALIFVILIAANMVGMSQYVTNAVLMGLRHTRALMVSEIAAALANVALSIALVKMGFGLAGVAFGTLVTMVIRNAWLAVHGAHVVGAPIAPYITRIYLPAGIVLALTMIALRAPVSLGWITSWPALLLFGIAGGLVFSLLAFLFVLDGEDRRLLGTLGRKRSTSARSAGSTGSAGAS